MSDEECATEVDERYAWVLEQLAGYGVEPERLPDVAARMARWGTVR